MRDEKGVQVEVRRKHYTVPAARDGESTYVDREPHALNMAFRAVAHLSEKHPTWSRESD